MKTFPRLLLLCLGVFLCCSSAQAKSKSQPAPAPLATPASEPPAIRAEAAPRISADVPPSASLQPFVDTRMGQILAPLGESAFVQPELIASMKASYADGMAAAPASRKPAYQAAQNVCDAMAAATTERQNAVLALRGALTTRSSEAEQPRGGGEAVERARNKDTFFVDSQKNAWIQRAGILRQNITALYLRERAVERQVGEWPTPKPAPAPAPVAPASDAPDPVVGQWLLEGRSAITLEANHTITGDRHGFWRYTSTTGAGRNYELHWQPPKNWVDYLVLSGDGKMLDGKTRGNKPFSVVRR